jgi:hypothetical protein
MSAGRRAPTIDLVRELPVSLIGFVVIATVMQQLQNLALGDLPDLLLWLMWGESPSG